MCTCSVMSRARVHFKNLKLDYNKHEENSENIGHQIKHHNVINLVEESRLESRTPRKCDTRSNESETYKN